MTQENKDLLFKDLCARLPYNTKVHGVYAQQKPDFDTESDYIEYIEIDGILSLRDIEWIQMCVSEVKPYLFPLDSITIEQERELSKLGVSYGEYALHDDIRGLGIMVEDAYIFFEYCYKHHIDFLGLIDMGLAIDATGLKIY